MTDTGYKNPGTVTTVDSNYTMWQLVDNVKVQDDTSARADLGYSGDASYSEFLRGTNFGFNIPANARIDGIIVKVRCNQSGTAEMVKDHTVRLRKADTTVSGNRAGSEYWTQTKSNRLHGGNSDRWDFSTVTPAEVNNSGFGVEVMAKNYNSNYPPSAYIDNIQVIVYYTEGSGETPPPEPGTVIVAGKYLYPEGHNIIKTIKGFNWSTMPVKAIMVNDDYVYSSEDTTLADVEEYEVNGGGYNAGGMELPLTGRYAAWNPDEKKLIYHSGNMEFPNISLTFRSIIFYMDDGSTSSDKPLLMAVVRDSNKTLANTTYILELDNGLFGENFTGAV